MQWQKLFNNTKLTKMAVDTIKQALNNHVEGLNIRGLELKEHHQQDKRKTVRKFFLQCGKSTISPAFNYNDMNIFLLGLGRARQFKDKL